MAKLAVVISLLHRVTSRADSFHLSDGTINQESSTQKSAASAVPWPNTSSILALILLVMSLAMWAISVFPCSSDIPSLNSLCS
jgi:hypothetical protein